MGKHHPPLIPSLPPLPTMLHYDIWEHRIRMGLSLCVPPLSPSRPQCSFRPAASHFPSSSLPLCRSTRLFRGVILQSNPLGYKYRCSLRHASPSTTGNAISLIHVSDRSITVANFIGSGFKDALDCEVGDSTAALHSTLCDSHPSSTLPSLPSCVDQDLRCLQSESADELMHVQVGTWIRYSVCSCYVYQHFLLGINSLLIALCS